MLFRKMHCINHSIPSSTPSLKKRNDKLHVKFNVFNHHSSYNYSIDLENLLYIYHCSNDSSYRSIISYAA